MIAETHVADQLVSGGFYVTRAQPPPKGLGNGLLPDTLLTLSSCLADFFPDSWAFDWVNCQRDKRVEALVKLGINECALEPVLRLVSNAFNQGELGWPCVWQSSSSAMAALSTLGEVPRDIVILELGVAADAIADLVGAFGPGIDAGGFVNRLQQRCPLDPVGVSLGWEVLGLEDGGAFHSWLCNGIERDAAATLGITPGVLGLLATKQDADAVVQLIDDGLGAEPVPWFAGLIARVA